MKVLLFGKASKNIESLVKKIGLELVQINPDVIISYGGDGTLLSSERQYPGIPKLPLRNSQICNKCARHEDGNLLQNLLDGTLKLKEYKKLQTNVYGKDLFALNDFVIRNEEAIHGIRFKVFINDIPVGFFIGDGIVIATPFGSTGYFKSITGENFESGFGLAFNNPTQKAGPVYFDEQDMDTDRAGFQLARGKAVLVYDNSPDSFHIAEGTNLEFKLADQVAKIYQPTSLRCPDCKMKLDNSSFQKI